MENVVSAQFWKGKRVFVTGHTGFKGAWLCVWLKQLGADLTGYSLPPHSPGVFEDCGVENGMRSLLGDIRDFEKLKTALIAAQPEIVFHLAAQALVRRSYKDPLETYSTNVMGTAHVLESIRQAGSVRAAVSVTTDKCYENNEWVWGYRECDPLGGRDPYSSSKAAAELVTAAYRESYFPADRYAEHRTAIATARAGNVIGGGDWAEDRLIPDIIRAMLAGKPVYVRNPNAIRPWQHVLDPLGGYILLAERLFCEGAAFASAWNFGPSLEDARPVSWIVERIVSQWEDNAGWVTQPGNHPHEAKYLKLDCAKAIGELGWRSGWRLDQAIDALVEWYRAKQESKDMNELTIRQIDDYSRAASQTAGHRFLPPNQPGLN